MTVLGWPMNWCWDVEYWRVEEGKKCARRGEETTLSRKSCARCGGHPYRARSFRFTNFQLKHWTSHQIQINLRRNCQVISKKVKWKQTRENAGSRYPCYGVDWSPSNPAGSSRARKTGNGISYNALALVLYQNHTTSVWFCIHLPRTSRSSSSSAYSSELDSWLSRNIHTLPFTFTLLTTITLFAAALSPFSLCPRGNFSRIDIFIFTSLPAVSACVKYDKSREATPYRSVSQSM